MMLLMGRIEVRGIEARDAAAYVELLRRLDSESPFLMWEPGERAITAEAVVERLEAGSEERLHLVALHDDVVVGFLVCHRGSLARIHHRCDFTMAVGEEHRGQGIGGRLLHEMETWATATGIERIELTVMAHNHGAIRLYTEHGYVREGLKKGAIRVAGQPVDEVVMAKILPQPAH